MAGLNLPSLKLDILADGSSAIKEIKNVRDAAREMINVGSQMTKFTTVPIVTALTAAVKSAGDFNETLGKTNVVFDEMTDTVMAWSENAIDAMGMAQSTALEMSSAYGDMATGMGLATSESAQMSMNLTQLAADIASFKNKSLSEVNTALMGIFTGETESLKQLGIVMTQANLQQYAYSQGITQTIDKLSQAEQVQLRYSYVMAQSANAQGDFARTGDSLNNRTRKLTETLKELANSYGATLTEKVSAVIGKLQEGAQYLAELDDGAKNTIVTIGLIVAAAGPLLLVGGKIIGVITTLKTSLLALTANPVLLGITAAIAALSGLAAIVNNTGDGLDKTSKTYQNLKNAIEGGAKGEITIDDSQVEKLNQNPPTITVNADGQNALNEAQRIADLLNGDAYDGMLSIDGDPEKAETALQELEDAINEAKATMTIDADGNAVLGTNGEVERLKKAIAEAKGIVAITADPVEKARLEAYLTDLETQLNGLGVAIGFSETPETTANIEAFKAKMASLPKDETYSNTGEFKITEATAETIQEYAEALAAAATATGDYADAVSNLDNIVDAETARKTAEVNRQIAEEAQYQAALLAEGLTTQEEANAAVQQAITDGQAEIAMIEKKAEAQKELNETFANGLESDDAPTAAGAMLGMFQGSELTEEQRNASMERLLKANAEGTLGSLQSQRDARIALNALLKEATADQEALTTAQERYNQAVATANVNKEAAIKNAEDEAARTDVSLQAMEHYQDLLTAGFTPEDAIANTMAKYESVMSEYSGLQEDFQKILQGEDGAGLDLAGALQAETDLLEEQEAAQTQLTAATEEATAARAAALQEFNTTLATIQEGFTASEIAGVLSIVEQTGIAISEADKNMITGGAQIIASLAGAIKDGETDIASAIETATKAAATSTKDTAASNGEAVGDSYVDGVAEGIKDGTSTAVAAAKASARAVNAAYKRELDINSPSGVAKREIGIQIPAGIGEGIAEGMPSVLRAIQSSTAGIISSATSVISKGAYTVPVTAAAVSAPVDIIDYDKLADAMANRPIAFSVGAGELATATRNETARQQAIRVQQINAGYGGKGALR